MKRLTVLFLISLAIGGIYSQQIVPVASYFRNGFVFESGYWVYRDTATHAQDSITLVNCIHNYIYPNPGNPDYQEYYKMNFHSHSFGYNFNEFIITLYWKRNGGGEWGQLGQPVMHIAGYPWYPQVGNGFNGYQIMDIFPSFEVNGTTFNNVVWSRIFENEQYQHEFDYDTDLYFSPGVGIIRKAWIDGQGISHCWDLIDWQSNIYTGIGEDKLQNNEIIVFPNPASDQITVTCTGLEYAEILNLQGDFVCRSTARNFRCEFDLKDLPPGVYFLKLNTAEGVYTRKVVVNRP